MKGAYKKCLVYTPSKDLFIEQQRLKLKKISMNDDTELTGMYLLRGEDWGWRYASLKVRQL